MNTMLTREGISNPGSEHPGARCSALRAALSALMLLLSSGAGCGTFSGFSSAPLASVTIWNQPRQNIEAATEKVFLLHGYQPGQARPNELAFLRPGTADDNAAYGSLFFKEKVTERVLVSIQPKQNGSTLLSCTASLVEDEGDPRFEDAHKISSRSRKEGYQEILKQIQSRLQTP